MWILLISESRLTVRFGLLILGARYDKGEINFNLSPLQVLKAGMTLIVMGEVNDIANAHKAI